MNSAIPVQTGMNMPYRSVLMMVRRKQAAINSMKRIHEDAVTLNLSGKGS
jgi:hypothetical protein